MVYVGFVIAMRGFTYGGVIAKHSLQGSPVQGWSSLMVVILFFGGTQMHARGAGRIHLAGPGRIANAPGLHDRGPNTRETRRRGGHGTGALMQRLLGSDKCYRWAVRDLLKIHPGCRMLDVGCGTADIVGSNLCHLPCFAALKGGSFGVMTSRRVRHSVRLSPIQSSSSRKMVCAPRPERRAWRNFSGW